MFEEPELDRLAPRLRGGPVAGRDERPGRRRPRSRRRHRGHRLRLPRQGRQALAAVHHAGRLRRPDRRRTARWPTAPSAGGDPRRRRSAAPCRSRRSTRPRSSTTTSRTTTPSATATRRCTASTASATAINVGDYLIGLGYRLVSREAQDARRRRRRRHPRQAGRRPPEAVRRPGRRAALARLARQAAHAARRAEDLRAEDRPGVRGGAVHRRSPVGSTGF